MAKQGRDAAKGAPKRTPKEKSPKEKSSKEGSAKMATRKAQSAKAAALKPAAQKKAAALKPAAQLPEVLHPDTVRAVARRMPPERQLAELAELFKVFGDSTRMRILSALSYSELCVNDLSALLGMTASAVSHQLKTLRATKLVRTRKAGKVVYYSLDDEHVNAIIAIGMQHMAEG